MKFSKAQKEAIWHKDGPMMVLAGPGSGKTAVITHRARILIEEYQIEPHKILIITFTKAAALEMKARFLKLMNGKFTPVQFGTFHAIFFSILKHAYHYTANNIIRESQKKQFLQEIIERLDLELEDINEFLEEIEGEISLVKGEMIALEHYFPQNCAKDVFAEIYHSYENKLRRSQLIDFDDMLVYCYELLKERKDICKMWQEQFHYILIDEFQDINRIQYEIIQMLASPRNNLCIVGDDDQSIYRFRGAKPEIMLNFPKDYPNAKQVLLDMNYRSTYCIVHTAAKVIVHNKHRFSKSIQTENERGMEVSIREFETLPEQNTFVLEQIRDLRERGIAFREMAVLFRTNTQARSLVGKMMEYHIPFRMKEMVPNLFEHWIAKNIIAYLQLAQGKRDRSLFLQIINRPKRYMGREVFDTPLVDFERLRTFYEEKKWMIERIDRLEYDLDAISRMPPYAAINYIRKGIDYDSYLVEYARYRRLKSSDLLDLLDEIQDSAKEYQTLEQWFAYMEQYTLELEEQSKQRENIEEDALSLVTMHGAKGLEYEVVFIVDANEGITPHHKAVLEEDLEEERRMFYVAMTRAKKQLFLSYVKERYNKELEMSRFVAEILEDEL